MKTVTSLLKFRPISPDFLLTREERDMKNGQAILVDGKPAEFVAASKGWNTIIDHEGTERKVRNKAISEVRDEDDDDDGRVRLYPKMENYVKGLGSTPSGRDTIDIDDNVAVQLRGMDFKEAASAVAKAMTDMGEKTTAKELIEKYDHLNPGMQRMNLGNRLRSCIRRTEEV
jgi:hypothetical protein